MNSSSHEKSKGRKAEERKRREHNPPDKDSFDQLFSRTTAKTPRESRRKEGKGKRGKSVENKGRLGGI
jgi:hypothetical protein